MTVYVGMDVHRKRSQIAVLDAAGEEHKRAAAGSGVLKRRYQIRQLLDASDERARGSLGRRSGRHLLHRPSSIAASVDRTVPPV